MPHHPAPTAPVPHTHTHLPTPPTLLQYLRASGQKILKNWGTSFSRTIRHFSPLVSLFTDCHRLHWDGSGAIFCELTFISKPCLLGDAWYFLLFWGGGGHKQKDSLPSFKTTLQSVRWQLPLTTTAQLMMVFIEKPWKNIAAHVGSTPHQQWFYSGAFTAKHRPSFCCSSCHFTETSQSRHRHICRRH